MELDNFELEEFNEYNGEHKQVLGVFMTDPDTKRFLGNLIYAFKRIEQRKKEEDKCNGVYVAYYNNEPVGYISLFKVKTKNVIEEKVVEYDSYQIAASILPAYRKQHMASLLLEEFSEKVFEIYPEIEKLDLVIDSKNIGSIKSAELADYHKQGNKYSRNRPR